MSTDRVLVDLGGVLTGDPWQSLLLTPGGGLVDRLGLDREKAVRAADDAWEVHARQRTDEAEYWHEISQKVGVDISASLVAEVESELLVSLPGAQSAVRFLRDAGVPWGSITNNTSFWYEKQLARLGVTPSQLSWTFTSFAAGLVKEDVPGLFEFAAATVDPSTTLVIDDRPENVIRARSAGFVAECFSQDGSEPLLDLIRRGLGRHD